MLRGDRRGVVGAMHHTLVQPISLGRNVHLALGRWFAGALALVAVWTGLPW
jgi:hypothetical protein